MNEKSNTTNNLEVQVSLDAQDQKPFNRFYQNPVVKKIDDLFFKFKISKNRKYILLFIVPFTLLVTLLLVNTVKGRRQEAGQKPSPTPTVFPATQVKKEKPVSELTEPEKLKQEVESFDTQQKDLQPPILDWKFSF